MLVLDSLPLKGEGWGEVNSECGSPPDILRFAQSVDLPFQGEVSSCTCVTRCHDAIFSAPASAILRNSKRCSFPVWVFGNALTYSIARGYLYGATVFLT